MPMALPAIGAWVATLSIPAQLFFVAANALITNFALGAMEYRAENGEQWVAVND